MIKKKKEQENLISIDDHYLIYYFEVASVNFLTNNKIVNWSQSLVIVMDSC